MRGLVPIPDKNEIESRQDNLVLSLIYSALYQKLSYFNLLLSTLCLPIGICIIRQAFSV